MVDYSIELAHIYSDEKIGDEQASSIDEGVKFINGLKENLKTFSTTLLIDNYSPSSFTLDENELVDLAKSYGISFDFICYEAELADLCDLLIKDMDPAALVRVKFPKFNKESLVLKHGRKIIGIRDYFETHYRNTCAALVACWHLARLGIYKISEEKIKRFSENSFQATKTLTVLPKKYKANEDKVLTILGNSFHKNVLKNIEYVFF